MKKRDFTLKVIKNIGMSDLFISAWKNKSVVDEHIVESFPSLQKLDIDDTCEGEMEYNGDFSKKELIVELLKLGFRVKNNKLKKYHFHFYKLYDDEYYLTYSDEYMEADIVDYFVSIDKIDVILSSIVGQEKTDSKDIVDETSHWEINFNDIERIKDKIKDYGGKVHYDIYVKKEIKFKK
jgi:hypothetical protein